MTLRAKLSARAIMYPRTKMTHRAKSLSAILSSCNFLLSCKNGSVQKYFHAVLYARPNLTATSVIMFSRAFKPVKKAF